ncbi:hypothetical protein ACFL6H_06320 [Candidatus Latescibacterota bacterium]
MTPVKIALLIGFGIIVFSEFFVIEFQRFTFQIARANDLIWNDGGNVLLPIWYTPVAWIIRILHWAVLIAMWFFFSWKLAILLIVGHFLFIGPMLIPYSDYAPVLKGRYREFININSIEAEAMAQMLKTCRLNPINELNTAIIKTQTTKPRFLKVVPQIVKKLRRLLREEKQSP